MSAMLVKARIVFVKQLQSQPMCSQPTTSLPSAQIKLELLVESEEPNIAETLQHSAVIRAREVAKGVYLARYVAQCLNSASLAETATRLASFSRHQHCRIRKPPQSMGAF